MDPRQRLLGLRVGVLTDVRQAGQKAWNFSVRKKKLKLCDGEGRLEAFAHDDGRISDSMWI